MFYGRYGRPMPQSDMMLFGPTILLLGVTTASSALAAEKLQAPIQAAALNHYFERHPPPKGERVCVAVGGYRAPSKTFRALLKRWSLNRSATCHFREGQIVFGTTHAALNEEGVAEVEVSKIEFGDISTSLDRVSYRLEKKPDWSVTWEGGSKQ